MCKKLLIITNCGAEEASNFERFAKDIYDIKNTRISLCFMHKGKRPHEIGEMSKKKKPLAIIFHDNLSAAEIVPTKTSIEHKKVQTRFFHISKSSVLNQVEYVPDHLAVKLALLH